MTTSSIMTLSEALEACRAFHLGAWFNGVAFVQKAVHSGELSFEDQIEMFEVLGRADLAEAVRVDGLHEALKQGKVSAFGLPVPHQLRQRPELIPSSMWKYLRLNPVSGIATGRGQEFVELSFRINPGISTTATSKMNGRPSRRDAILALYRDVAANESSQRQQIQLIRAAAIERFGPEVRGFEESTIRKTITRKN